MKDKIQELEQLAEIIEQLKGEGKTVMHCHGCFDLLHIGHIKHFEAAKAGGDILIVTLTPDHLVNKGPGRPAFNEQMRMEALASLEVVDYVALNKWATSIETLELLKPSFYVKGSEYRDFEKDLTGNIQKEVDAIRSVDGDIYFTDEITFSSSKLINAHFNPLGDEAQRHVNMLKGKYGADDIIGIIDGLSDAKVLVIGDTIIDEYFYVRPLGKSSKSPTLSTLYKRAEKFAGGVLAIANHLKEFAGDVHLVTCLGRENDQMEIIEPKLSAEISTKFFYREDGPTPTKRRYMTEFLNSKIFEVTYMKDSHIPQDLEKEIISYLEGIIKEYDLVMISDFGHGLISPALQDFLCKTGKFVAVNAQTNSNNFGYNYITKYRDADYISIDENEIRLPYGDKYGELESLITRLHEDTACPSITITLGQKGAVYSKDQQFNFAPAFATNVVDSVGAGDAVLSVSALCALKACPGDLLPYIGNCVGALAVQILGNERPVNRTELNKMISHMFK
ncbi:MAG: PfkB family carbohydrate kinase [Bacteroidia bacterium]|nr:PfkB family carbohydrate kinase [Bacteroidia bacterium]